MHVGMFKFSAFLFHLHFVNFGFFFLLMIGLFSNQGWT